MFSPLCYNVEVKMDSGLERLLTDEHGEVATVGPAVDDIAELREIFFSTAF